MLFVSKINLHLLYLQDIGHKSLHITDNIVTLRYITFDADCTNE